MCNMNKIQHQEHKNKMQHHSAFIYFILIIEVWIGSNS